MAIKRKETVKDEISGTRANPVILLFLMVSGSCGLVYEILWMKMLTLVIGNTVFSITTVLTAFMGGLALGSFLAGRFIDKIKDPLRTYGILEGGIGALCASCCRFSLQAQSPCSGSSIRASIPLFTLSACCAFLFAESSCWFPPP